MLTYPLLGLSSTSETKYYSKITVGLYLAGIWVTHLPLWLGFTTGSPLYYSLGSYCAMTSILVFCGICHTLDNPRLIPDYIPEPLEYLNLTEEYINTNTHTRPSWAAQPLL